MCGKRDDRVCRSRGMGCYKFGRVGHVSRDYPQPLGDEPVMFSLQPSGPQEGQLSGVDDESSEGTCSSHYEDS